MKRVTSPITLSFEFDLTFSYNIRTVIAAIVDQDIVFGISSIEINLNECENTSNRC
mgnify:CR=1 FL=1